MSRSGVKKGEDGSYQTQAPTRSPSAVSIHPSVCKIHFHTVLQEAICCRCADVQLLLFFLTFICFPKALSISKEQRKDESLAPIEVARARPRCSGSERVGGSVREVYTHTHPHTHKASQPWFYTNNLKTIFCFLYLVLRVTEKQLLLYEWCS